ncbi:XrtA/PEP-CTERM system TPR-repeat protein PrsT [Glaciecola siphonariae]|uniref:XrtA/PEP-CTERM system TPR-repeat protein PrsT n=1 Tax=Glaciecola siphonariae TaxID=521012 RepID=A0ABV9LW53_9ALTE
MLRNNPQSRRSTPVKRIAQALGAGVLLFGLMACSGKTVDEHIQQAQVYVDQGDNNAAIIELKSAVQQDPRSAQARFELGKIYIEQKNFESAEKELSRALELGHPPPKVIPLLSEAYQRTGANVALADLSYDEQSMTTVERLEIGFRKLQSLIQLEKNAEARILIDQMAPLESSSVYKGLIEAHRDILDKDYESALTQAIALQERAPLNRDVLSFTARLYMLNGQEEKAAEIYEEYSKVATDDIESKFALANMLVQQGETERAEVYVDELMQISDTNGLLNQLKGIIRAANGDFQGALDYSVKAIQFGQADPRVRLVAGFAAYQLGEFEKAVMHLTVVAPALPDGHPGLRILAASQLQSDMGTDASNILPRIGELSAQDASLFSRAGYELIQEGNIDAAKEVIAQADKISETADDLTRLGILKLSVNDVEGLINLEQAVDKAPESVTAKSTLATAYLGTNQLDKALALALEWQQSAPNAIEGFLLESEVYQRQANYEKALQILEKASQIDSNNAALLVAQIRLNLRQKNIDTALTFTETLLTQEPENVVALASLFAIKSDKGQASDAISRIQSAFNKDKSNQQLALLLARAGLASQQPKLAVEALDSIEATRGAPSQYWSMRGFALLRDNQTDAAEKHYETWMDLFPKQENAVIGRLLILDAKRQYERGLDLIVEFLARKDNLQVRLLEAYFYAMAGEAEQARTKVNAIDDKYQALPFLRGVKARIALLEGRPTDALDDARASFEDNPKTDNLIVLVQALDMTGQADAAYQLVEQFSQANPNDMRVKLLLAQRQISKDSQQAIKTYSEMLEKTPNSFVVLNNLAYLLMEDGDLDTAAGLAKRAYDLQPDNAATVDTYAQILIRQNNIEDAVEAYNKVMSDEVTNEEVILNYIEALLKNGSTVVAKRRLEARSFVLPESLERIDALRQQFDL